MALPTSKAATVTAPNPKAASQPQPRSRVRISTPELLWHGGGNENGKPDPVYAVDIHPTNVLATGGIDANIPPKGSVRVTCLKNNLPYPPHNF